jgi:hypothetical protein
MEGRASARARTTSENLDDNNSDLESQIEEDFEPDSSGTDNPDTSGNDGKLKDDDDSVETAQLLRHPWRKGFWIHCTKIG